MYHAHIRARQFNQALALASRFPKIQLDLQVIVFDQTTAQIRPYQTVNDGVRSYFTIQQFIDNNSPMQIVRKRFEFPQGAHIVVISSPICNPCKRLFTWLKSEPKLMNIMQQHTTWLTPADNDLFAKEMLTTYQTYAPIKLHYAHHQSEWPEIKYWATPTFYFYQDGQLQGQLVGWPKEGHKRQLVNILKSLNLL